MRSPSSPQPPRRRHPHAVRIDPALWAEMAAPAARLRLDRSAWTRGLIEDAIAGRIIIIPARLGRALQRRATRTGMSVPALVERLLENALSTAGRNSRIATM
jgi:hypothetical protein